VAESKLIFNCSAYWIVMGLASCSLWLYSLSILGFPKSSQSVCYEALC